MPQDLDITTHIKLIEMLKCALLNDTAALYESMRKPSRREEQDESLTGLLITLYRLSKALGTDYAELNRLTADRLRNEMLNDKESLELQELLKHLNR